jgi:hypothetical protein
VTLQALLLWLLGGLLGSMLFFAIVVAPAVFRALPGEPAGILLRALFPRYYLWGLVSAVLATLLAHFAKADGGVIVICAGVTVLFVFTRQQLLPAINRARDARGADEIAARRFRRLHGLSMLVNLSQMLLLMAATGMLIWL